MTGGNEMQIQVIDHPLIQHKLTIMRQKETSSGDFRKLLKEITLLMGYELTRDLPMEDIEIETPLEVMKGKRVAGKKVGIVPILRAGFGMLDGLLELVPSARVGVIGLYRDPVTAKPVEYYCKLPDVENRDFILIDPMLATGGSAVAAIDMMKAKGVKNIKFMCLVAAPEGVQLVNDAHPDVPVYTAALDRQLNEKKCGRQDFRDEVKERTEIKNVRLYLREADIFIRKGKHGIIGFTIQRKNTEDFKRDGRTGF